jgi:replication factor C subunit 3/5
MSVESKTVIPWVEKYRPNNFENIILDDINKQIFQNILEKNYFPNILFYGPPGTGKTTTIINLIQYYQTKNNQKNRCSVIHLNASDERGIDIIRNQIYQFVKSKNLFEGGLKFIILDEVDYMTKNAQQALKYLLQTSSKDVRFCLICNYISKIDESLKNEFISVRFNQLPTKYITEFIKKISISENLNLSDDVISTIQQLYQSDIRSMINFMQLNQHSVTWEKIIITDVIYENIYNLMINSKINSNEIIVYIFEISIQYNKDKHSLLNDYANYLIRNKPEIISHDFLNIIETVVHSTDTDIKQLIIYFLVKLRKLQNHKIENT